MLHKYILIVTLVLGTIVSASGQGQQTVPEQVYSGLEYLHSLAQSDVKLNPEQLLELIDFVRFVPPESSLDLKKQGEAVGVFYAFSVQGQLSAVIDYAYNPDIPVYVTMPSSLQSQEWVNPQVYDALRYLPSQVESVSDISLLRGKDRETITPDINTGGYYTSTQNRLVTVLPGSTGPVLISVSSQPDPSEVGKKGCVVGDDRDWNYLYSSESGLSRAGLGWVDSYMYHAYSVTVYVPDPHNKVLRVGLFKWLSAGWARINMVKSSHILRGIKRFASDFKGVLESPDLPEVSVLAEKYQELLQMSEQELRRVISPYMQALSSSGELESCSSTFRHAVSSGEYLQQMSQSEMVRVLLLDYVKLQIGRESYVRSVIE